LHEKFFVIKEIPATRGNILSDSGDLLATSLPFYEIAFDPTVVDEKVFLENINDLSEKFSTFFKTHDKTYYNNLFISARKQNKKYIRIKERLINHNEKKEILSWPIFKLGKYRG
jgi:cell division protein FtsI (penicillin-binding protein 3)